MKIKKLEKFIKKNFADSDGVIDISGLDFTEYDVNISNIKADNLFQNHQNVKGSLYQNCQEVEGSLYQNCQEVKGNLFQNRQKVGAHLIQDEQEVGGSLYN